MENYIGKICPFCKTEIKEGDAVKVCPSCGIPHHQACWEENKGCTTFGCSEQHYEEQHTNPTDVCINCGAPLGDGQEFCPKCGTPKGGPKKRICGKCGAELQNDQDFCPKCGTRYTEGEDATNSAIAKFNEGVKKENKKKKLIPIITVAAIVVIGLILFFVLRGTPVSDVTFSEAHIPNFKELFSSYSSKDWCEIASDGSYMRVDTNPDDEDGDSWYLYYDALTEGNDFIEQANSKLGFSAALTVKMNETTWSMGRQTDENDNYKVSYTYHPDKGLEVLYELKK